MELSENDAAQRSAAVMTRALLKPPACAARSATPPSIFDLSALVLEGGSWVASYPYNCYFDNNERRREQIVLI